MQSEALYGVSWTKMQREGVTLTREKIKTPVTTGQELFQNVSRKVLSLGLSVKVIFLFLEVALGQRFLNRVESCWWGVGGRTRGCSAAWRLMNWCSNLLMRSKLSPLCGFVHRKGHLPCHGHRDSSLTASKLVSRCVVVCSCGWDNVRDYLHLTSSASLLELEETELEKEDQRGGGAQNCFNTFINSREVLKHWLWQVTLFSVLWQNSAGFLWTLQFLN